MIKISLIVPFYNAENYIERLLMNINIAFQKVSGDKLEVIFVDDIGTDSSRKLLEDSKLFKYKIVDCGKNQGLGGARNLGVANATGDWIMFMDHDDLLDENAFRLLIDKIDSDNELNFIRYNYIERTIARDVRYQFKALENSPHVVFPVMAWSKIIKKELYVESVNHLKHEDNIWTFDFIQSGLYKKIKYGFVDEYIYIYDRTNENSITQKLYPEDMKIVYRKLINVLSTCDQDIKAPLVAFYLYSLKYSLFDLKNVAAFIILIRYTLNLNLNEYKSGIEYRKLTQEMKKN